MGLQGGYDNRIFRERNKNEIVLTKKLSLSGAPIDQNALRFSQMQYGLFDKLQFHNLFPTYLKTQKHYRNEPYCSTRFTLLKRVSIVCSV